MTGGGNEDGELAVRDFQAHEQEGPDGRRSRCLVGVALVIAHHESSARNGRHGAVERHASVQGAKHDEDTGSQE